MNTNQASNRAQSMKKPESKQNSKSKLVLQQNQQVQQNYPSNNSPNNGVGLMQQHGIQNMKMSSRRGESQHQPHLQQNLGQPHHQPTKSIKVNYGFFYQQQQLASPMPIQYAASQSQQTAPQQNNSSLITQVGKNQALHADLTNQEKAALQNQQQMQQQQYQKFGKEPLPPHLAACGPQKPWAQGKKTLILDLDETLVHSSFKPPQKPDIILPVEIEGNICNVFVLIRPGTEFFLQRLSKCYELVIYTASLSKYADPLIDILDTKPQKVIDYRLFREHCTFFQGVFIKDMSLPGRQMQDSIIIDNSPTSYAFHQENALPILSWYDDPKDRCLFELIPLLESLAEVDDVRKYIPKFVTADHKVDFQKASYILSNATTKSQLKMQQKQANNQQQQQQQQQQIPVDMSDLEKPEEEEEDENTSVVVEEIKQPIGKKSISHSQQRRRKSSNLSQINNKVSQNISNQNNEEEKLEIQQNNTNNQEIQQQNKNNTSNIQTNASNFDRNNKIKNNSWTQEEQQNNQNQSSSELQQDQSNRNFSKQKYDPSQAPQIMPSKDQNQTQTNLIRDDGYQQIRQDSQKQQQRPMTRENQRNMLQLQDEQAAQSQNAQQIKNALVMTQAHKSRKLNNQYFSRQSQLQQLLQTDQQQYKKSFNSPSNNQFNPAMTDGSIKLLQPSSKTPNNKHANQINFHRNVVNEANSLSLQRQQQPGILNGSIINVQGMFSTPKNGQQNQVSNGNNSMFKFFPQSNQQSYSHQASTNNSQNNSEVNTFRGQRDYSNKNLVRNQIQLQINDFKGAAQSINKQRRVRRNNDNQLNSTQPLVQNISSSDIEVNETTPKHLKTPSRVQQSRYTGSLVNKRRQNSRQKLVLSNGGMGSALNSSYQRLVGANINLDNSNFIQNSNIVINNIQAPVAFGAQNQLLLGGNRPISAKRQNSLMLNNFSSPKSNQNVHHQILYTTKYGNINGISDISQLSPYNTPLNKNLGALSGQMVGVGMMSQDYAQKRMLRGINRKSNAFSHS